MNDMLAVLIMNGAFASAIPLLKYAVATMHPFMVVALRMIMGGGLFCLYQLWSDRSAFSRPLNIKLLFFTALIPIYGLCMSEAWALQVMSATKAALMWSFVPLMSAALAHWMHKRRLSRAQWGAIMLSTVSIIVLIVQDESGAALMNFMALEWAEVGMIGAVFAASYGYFLLQQLMQEGHTVALANGVPMLLGGVMSMITFCSTEGIQAVNGIAWWPALGYVVAVVLLVNIIAFSLQLSLLQRTSVPLLALSSFITPLWSILISVFWMGEQWRWMYGIVIVCVGFALYMLYQDDTPPVHSSDR